MVKFYVYKIKNSDGVFTINDVPARWKAAVEEALAE